jgi:hypothetical protein
LRQARRQRLLRLLDHQEGCIVAVDAPTEDESLWLAALAVVAAGLQLFVPIRGQRCSLSPRFPLDRVDFAG